LLNNAGSVVFILRMLKYSLLLDIPLIQDAYIVPFHF